MSHSARVGLPRTRSLRRARGRRGWLLAVGVALLANAAVVVGLGQISRLAPPPAPAPLAVHRLTRIDPDPVPPPPPEAPREAVAASDAALVAPALPLLALPAMQAAGLPLPDLGSLDAALDLPLVIPPLTAPALPGAVGADGPGPVPSAAYDKPAVRLGGLDLERFYPRSAKARGITGRSRIRSRIDAAGRVTAVEVVESEPPGVFDQAAERLGRAQRYTPAERAGQAVPSEHETVIEWSLR